MIPEIEGTHREIEIAFGTEITFALIATSIAILGWWIARGLYKDKQLASDAAFAARAPKLALALENKWYVDELYAKIVVRPLEAGSRFLWKSVDAVIDGIAAMLGFTVARRRRAPPLLPDRQRSQLRADVLHRRDRVHRISCMTKKLSVLSCQLSVSRRPSDTSQTTDNRLTDNDRV